MIAHRYSRPLVFGAVLVLLFLTYLSLRPEYISRVQFPTPISTGNQESNNPQTQTPPPDPASNHKPAASTPPNPSDPHDLHPPIYNDSPALLSKIGKVTVAANKLNSPTIERALRSHDVQNEIHGYVHHIASNEVVGSLVEADSKGMPKGAWSKPAYLLSVVVAELAKKEEDRLEWIFWFDADTIIMNPQTPLEIFLPPTNDANVADVHMLIASNWDGINSGVMAFRIHPWTVSILSTVSGYPIFLQNRLKTDRFRDQSAFQWLLEDPDSPLGKTKFEGRHNWATVPMRWFNSLPVNNAFMKNGTWLFGKNMSEDMFDKGTNEVYNDGHGSKINPWKVMRGDMVVHFAGSTRVRDSWMGPWLDRCEAYLPEWSNASTQKRLVKEVKDFYKNLPYQWEKEKKLAEQKKENQKKKQEEKQKEEKKKNEEEEKKKNEEEERKKKEEEQKKKEEEQKKKEEEQKKTEEEQKQNEEDERKKAEEEEQKRKEEEQQADKEKSTQTAEASPAPQAISSGNKSQETKVVASTPATDEIQATATAASADTATGEAATSTMSGLPPP
ncbi:hypothetical protein B7463_g5811, partial [Scytalidium lignicola]